MKKHISYIILTGAILLFLSFGFQVNAQSLPTITMDKPIKDMSISELQAKIVEILSVIQQLQALIAQLQPEGVGVSCNFYRNLYPGTSGSDVKCLQQYLNNADHTLASSGLGSPSNETIYYGSLTRAAVKKWQDANNIEQGAWWGYFGPKSRAKYNELAGIPGEQSPYVPPGDGTSEDKAGTYCGDSIAQRPSDQLIIEDCDGADLRSKTCISQGFTGGTLSCNTDCSFNISQCTGTGPLPTPTPTPTPVPTTSCGDNIIQSPNSKGVNEVCDGTSLNNQTCITKGYIGGTLLCSSDCLTFNTTNCTSPTPLVNNAPVLNSIGNKSVDENNALSFIISATDADDNPLTYSAQSIPSGALFNTLTRTFTWTPTYTQSGTYTLTFTVSDSSFIDSETITITVNNVPEPEPEPQCGDGTCNGTETCSTCSQDCGACPAGQTTSQISQFGITWTFDKEYQYGQFANGDYWVLGPVTIVGINPLSTDISGRVMHGSMVNPSPTDGTQGYDNAMANNAYASSYNVALDVSSQNSLVLNPSSSLVSTISVNTAGARPQIKTAAVLTVLDSVPLNNGATVFRPPYSGSDKTYYFVDDLNTNLLPSLMPTSSAPSLTTVKNYFQRVQLDHKMGWTGRYQHPANNMPDYGSSIASRTAVGALRLMLNDSIDDKMPALINYVQMGIDFYGILKAGGKWNGNGGHMEGRKLPITFAAVLLDNQEMKDAVSNADMNTFGENKGIRYSQKANDGNGIPLFAQRDCSESMYWRKLNDNSASGSKTCKDPYGYIDGGQTPGKSYLGCCLSQPWKATSIAVRIMPELRSVWNYDYFHDFSDRYADFGIWTQPDPCAPTDGDWNNYGITFGPDPSNPGECILDTDSSDGIGRAPDNHGDNKDWGYYGSGFANEMWDAYR